MNQNDNDQTQRYIFALGHRANKSIFAMPKADYETFKLAGLNSGATLCFQQPPAQLARVSAEATVVGVELSTDENDAKSLDVVRMDSSDAPQIFNRDRYLVYESPCLATAFPAVLSQNGIENTPELREQLDKHVLVIGPYKNIPDHHTSQVTATLIRMSQEPLEPPG